MKYEGLICDCKMKMKLEYTVKGVTLDVGDIIKIHEYYQAYCTAEYLVDNYEVDETEALELGYAVRDLMLHKDIDEAEAIERILRRNS